MYYLKVNFYSFVGLSTIVILHHEIERIFFNNPFDVYKNIFGVLLMTAALTVIFTPVVLIIIKKIKKGIKK